MSGAKTATRACDGCKAEGVGLTGGKVIPRSAPGFVEPLAVSYCDECWEAVDCADPITGTYGAASVEVRRVSEAERSTRIGATDHERWGAHTAR